MELLLSNIPPVRSPSSRDLFSVMEDLFHEAEGLRIASGYISAGALAEIKRLLEENKKTLFEIVIGMHGFDGFTHQQFQAAQLLDDYLRKESIGEIRIATAFRFHGKLYGFLKESRPFAGIIGSSNLSSVFDSQNLYETDFLIREEKPVIEINNFITNLSANACISLNKFQNPKFIESKNTLLEGHDGAEKVDEEVVLNLETQKTGVSFKIPIKADEAPQSNLNTYFGKGRENRALLGQVISKQNVDYSLLYPPNVKPTRLNVVNQSALNVIAGGVNYFPSFPKRKFVKQLDDFLEKYSGEGTHEITLNNAIDLLEKFESERKEDWSNTAFVNCLKAFKATGIENKAVLIIRRDRSITKGTGTLLSPDDRALGDSIKKYPVLTLYKLKGESDKGWENQPLWVPNIKLPHEKNFYRVDS